MTDTVRSLTLCLVIALVASFGIGLLRRRLRFTLDERSAGAVGTAVSFVASLFAFVLGLTIVNLWSRYNDADRLVDQEATRVGMMYDLVSALPSAAKLRQSLIRYVRSVSEEEWPLMAQGRMNPVTDQLKNEVVTEALALARTDPQMVTTAQNLTEHALMMSRDRHEREDLLETNLHPLIVVALAVSGLFTLVGFLLITISHRRVQFLVDFIMAGTMALNFYLLQALDLPLNGTGFSVSNEAFAKLSARISAPADIFIPARR